MFIYHQSLDIGDVTREDITATTFRLMNHITSSDDYIPRFVVHTYVAT